MKTFLIIGSATGIGKATAEKLVANGHRVIGTYHTTQPSFEHTNISYHPYDVLDDNHALDFIPETLDGVVYAPGSINLRPFKRIKPEAFVSDFQLQVVGAIQVIQASLDALKNGNNPSIVLYSTVAVQRGYNFHSQVATSKGAIEGLMRSLAAELAPSIRVNAVAPSITKTPLADRLLNSEQKLEANGQKHPLKRVGQPADLANATYFLLTDESSWMTGQVLGVDGGISKITAS